MHSHGALQWEGHPHNSLETLGRQQGWGCGGLGSLSGSGALGDSSSLSHLWQTLLLEKLRVARHPANEATFNVFYYLLACSDSTLR